MRIRQIKPAWFTDRDLQTRVGPATREFYIGLWMLADDDGWLEWDRDAIGVQLYGYLPLRRREREIERHAGLLVDLTPADPHLRILECGHAQVPKMPGHQRISDAKRVTTEHRKHLSRGCPHLPADARGTPRPPATVRKEERGKRNGTEQVDARERDDYDDEVAAKIAAQVGVTQ